MNLELTPEQEQIIKEELKLGRFHTVEEVISSALKRLQTEETISHSTGNRNLAQESAVREMQAFIEKNHVRLEGISVKELIREGHRL